jgi:hypothetical protein
MITFTDPATKILYVPLTEHDQWLEIPPDKRNECNCKTWSGKLSNITEHAAERYVKSGGNLIRAKTTEERETEKQQWRSEKEKEIAKQIEENNNDDDNV